MNRIYLYLFTAVFSLIVLVFFVFSSLNDKKLHIIICDVGQGDAILIITPTQAQILIDGGPDKAVLECLSRNMPFWDRSLEAIIMTHPHADHLVGLMDVVDRYRLSSFYTEDVKTGSELQNLLEAKLAAKNLSAKDLQQGDMIYFKDGVKIEILWPRLNTLAKTDQSISNLDLNGLSVVALITYGNFSALLTGDAEKTVMEQLANEAGDIDVLKVPHHGSRDGVSDSFLNIAKPELSVISLGEKNRYGHPSKETLELLKNHSSQILRTDRHGEIEILTDGKDFSVSTFR
jgi:competence protein ComEC